MTTSFQIEQALKILQQHFSNSLVAVYLHGSSVSGGLKPTSDIDILAVIENAVNKETRKQLIHDLMGVSGLYPIDPEGRRPLEVAIFSTQELSIHSYPAECEFIYGEWLRDDFEKGEFGHSSQDPEFTLILAQAQREAIKLYQSIDYMIPATDIQYVKQAMLDSLPNLLSSLDGDERNVLLTLARMWNTMISEQFVSKDSAANWAMDIVPSELIPILTSARDAYLHGTSVGWEKRKKEIQLCVDYMEQRIRCISHD